MALAHPGAAAPTPDAPHSAPPLDDIADLARLDFDSLLTDTQVQEFEANQTHWGEKRRIALIVLARTKEQLVTGFGGGSGPDALLELIEHLSDYEKHCKALQEMASIACARLIAATAATLPQGETV